MSAASRARTRTPSALRISSMVDAFVAASFGGRPRTGGDRDEGTGRDVHRPTPRTSGGRRSLDLPGQGSRRAAAPRCAVLPSSSLPTGLRRRGPMTTSPAACRSAAEAQLLGRRPSPTGCSTVRATPAASTLRRTSSRSRPWPVRSIAEAAREELMMTSCAPTARATRVASSNALAPRGGEADDDGAAHGAPTGTPDPATPDCRPRLVEVLPGCRRAPRASAGPADAPRPRRRRPRGGTPPSAARRPMPGCASKFASGSHRARQRAQRPYPRLPGLDRGEQRLGPERTQS